MMLRTLILAVLLALPAAAQIQIQGLEGLRQGEIEGDVSAEPLPDASELPDPPPSAREDVARFVDAGAARLRALDTLSNTVNDFEIKVGETLRFKHLIVTLEACRYPPDDPGAEAFAFLRIRDTRETEDRFDGWMVASSPAFSALDHPRYDIWVLNCSAA